MTDDCIDAGERNARGSIRGLSRIVKLAGKGLFGAVREAPGALRREYDCRTGKRTSANLILTWGCTSKCACCTAWRRTRHKDRELSCAEWIEVARKLVSLGAGTFELFGGDIFLRKDVVIPLVRELKLLGCEVHTATNSNLIDPQTAEALSECLDVIYISTDGVGELHDRVRGVQGTFGRVDRGLGQFVKARGQGNRPRLICNTTVSRYNVCSLARIAEFAARAGYDQIDFEYVGEFTDEIVARSRIGEYEPSPIFRRIGESSLVLEDAVSVLREQLRLAKQYDGPAMGGAKQFRVNTINIDVLSDSDIVHGTVPSGRCFVERREVVIDPYGSIAPCYFFDTFSLGNVRDGALDRSLETPDRARFRSYRDRGRLEMCKHCIHNVARNCGFIDTVKREFMERLRYWRVYR